MSLPRDRSASKPMTAGRDDALTRRRMQNRVSQQRFREKRNTPPMVFDVRTQPSLPPISTGTLTRNSPDEQLSRDEAAALDFLTSAQSLPSGELSWMLDASVAVSPDPVDAHSSTSSDTLRLQTTSATSCNAVTTYPTPSSSDALNINDFAAWRSPTVNSSLATSSNVADDVVHRHMLDAMNAEQSAVPLMTHGSWQSALHLAARGGFINIVRMILQHKVDSNVRDSDGQTPLMHAAAEGREDVANCLLASGACLGRSDDTGRTALHWAVEGRQLAVLKMLLHQNGGKLDPFVNFYDSKGRTPLHVAIEIGFEEAVVLLLQCGANLQLNTSKQ